MNTKYLITIISSMLFGFSIHYLIIYCNKSDVDLTKNDWAAIEYYNKYIHDPSKMESHDNGLTSINNPPDILPNLTRLVSAGEIKYANLVFPQTPLNKISAQTWMQFAIDHDSIIYGMGNPRYTKFKTPGIQPLHIQIWYHKEHDDDIIKLISLIDSLTSAP